MNSHDIFISYRREDGAEFAEGLANTLKGQGFRVFFDKKSLQASGDFPSEIYDAIIQSKEFIAIVTKSYFGEDKNKIKRITQSNDWVRQEIKLAIENKCTLFPILIDCFPPTANSLPTDISQITNKQYTTYDRGFDTFDKIINRIINFFSDETKENALIGAIKFNLEGVDISNNLMFNLACKDIIKLIKTEKDLSALDHIMSQKETNSMTYFYNKDFRFIVFYTLFTYYRRMHMIKKLLVFVDEYSQEFLEYSFINYVMTEYYLEKFNLAKTHEEEQDCLFKAMVFAKTAVSKIKDNSGILHSFSYSVAIALENDINVNEEDIKLALQYSKEIIAKSPDYGGIYYATKARILGCIGQYEEALLNLRYAQTLECPTHKDWILRIATYQKYELIIRMKNLSNEKLLIK